LELKGQERFPLPERGVRTLEWLYARNEAAPIALYNLVSDPFELNNLVDSPKYLGKITTLDGLIKEHMYHTGDDWSIGVAFPLQDYQTYEQGDRNAIELLRHAIVES
jgi:arylsulfatase A-like enzyme